MVETDAQATAGHEATQVIRKKEDVRPIEERVREFDSHYGPDIEVAGFSAVSGYALTRLRELFENLNPAYHVVLSRDTSDVKRFPLGNSRVYARAREGCIEVISEERLFTGEADFLYGRLDSFAKFDDLRASYKAATGMVGLLGLFNNQITNARIRVARLTDWEINTRVAYQKALGLVTHHYKPAEQGYSAPKIVGSPEPTLVEILPEGEVAEDVVEKQFLADGERLERKERLTEALGNAGSSGAPDAQTPNA